MPELNEVVVEITFNPDAGRKRWKVSVREWRVRYPEKEPDWFGAFDPSRDSLFPIRDKYFKTVGKAIRYAHSIKAEFDIRDVYKNGQVPEVSNWNFVMEIK